VGALDHDFNLGGGRGFGHAVNAGGRGLAGKIQFNHEWTPIDTNENQSSWSV
jgi:hypothetical protein